MGYMRHHAIIVTSFDGDAIVAARTHALAIGCEVTGRVSSQTNNYWTFLVTPDGSKETWEESDNGDERRACFRDWLNSQRYEDGSSRFDWVEVQYGDERGQTIIIDHSDAKTVMET